MSNELACDPWLSKEEAGLRPTGRSLFRQDYEREGGDSICSQQVTWTTSRDTVDLNPSFK